MDKKASQYATKRTTFTEGSRKGMVATNQKPSSRPAPPPPKAPKPESNGKK